MPRYIGQQIDGQCGAVAILNAEKWAGAKSTKKRLLHLVRLCKSNADGVADSDFDKAIRRNPHFSVRRMYKPTIPRLRKHLLNGAGALYSYNDGPRHKDEGHIIFIPGVFQSIWFGRGWIVTNISRSSVLRVSNRFFLDRIWRTGTPEDRTIWLVWPK